MQNPAASGRVASEYNQMAPSWVQILIVVLLVVLFFGRGKISEVMGDVAKGITSFRKGLKEDEEKPAVSKSDARTIDNETGEEVKVSSKD